VSEPLDPAIDDVPVRRLRGPIGHVASVLAVGLSLYALYWVVGIVQPQIYRVSFLLIVLVLTFLRFPARRSERHRVTPIDWLLVLGSVATLAWPIIDFERFVYRAATPLSIDLALGSLLVVLVLEATRRSVGWILPATALAFLAYSYLGPWLSTIGLGVLAHRGYGLDRVIGTLYMSLEGIFGVPLDVASTYIVLFGLYGAVLEQSGAGRFFLEWSMAAMGRSGSASGPGRSITLAGLLLGTVSGSGVATTVTLGSVGWPMLRNAGYGPEVAGGILSAAGIGAILCPPALGAAAFLIAEFLEISYLQVIVLAIVPALLYYLSIFLMIDIETRRMGIRPIHIATETLGALTRRYGYHFTSLIAIAGLLVAGFTPFRAVFWATALAVGLSFLRPETALGPGRLRRALERGATSLLSVATTTATAGIIVGIVTLTGLGLKVAGLIVALAGGQLVLTVVYAALAVWMLGLAVPVTASYIIAAVMVAPALVEAGVPLVAAHMFIFYYAVLSEVSPPTALSPFAAAAITGGRPIQTMMVTWKYTLPAFLVPFMFTLSPDGLGLLLRAPAPVAARTILSASMGVVSLALGAGGWWRGPVSAFERGLFVTAGLLLCYPTPVTDIGGVGLAGLAAVRHWLRTGRHAAAA
jgi:TRAP transporter 4TM/12TM fusion protein